MTSRRSFLTTLGMGIAATSPVLAQPQRRRSLFDFIFNQPETVDPGVRPDPSTWSNDTITAAWIGHATVLINFFGTMIITDPDVSLRRHFPSKSFQRLISFSFLMHIWIIAICRR